jgi:hypothetical protein
MLGWQDLPGWNNSYGYADDAIGRGEIQLPRILTPPFPPLHAVFAYITIPNGDQDIPFPYKFPQKGCEFWENFTNSLDIFFCSVVKDTPRCYMKLTNLDKTNIMGLL